MANIIIKKKTPKNVLINNNSITTTIKYNSTIIDIPKKMNEIDNDPILINDGEIEFNEMDLTDFKKLVVKYIKSKKRMLFIIDNFTITNLDNQLYVSFDCEYSVYDDIKFNYKILTNYIIDNKEEILLTDYLKNYIEMWKDEINDRY